MPYEIRIMDESFNVTKTAIGIFPNERLACIYARDLCAENEGFQVVPLY
jgi:hypothetical protein